jgi:hypothetical protein
MQSQYLYLNKNAVEANPHSNKKSRKGLIIAAVGMCAALGYVAINMVPVENSLN